MTTAPNRTDATDHLSPSEIRVGDVVLDTYDNPALVTRVSGSTVHIIMATGSDLGRMSIAPLSTVGTLTKVLHSDRIEWVIRRIQEHQRKPAMGRAR